MASLKLFQFFLLAHLANSLLVPERSHSHLPCSRKRVALFIFGDSNYDAGNNNYINTITSFQANFPPYGETFFHYPTGRFSDGRLISDFIAEYAKLPLLPPYKQPGDHNFSYGVNFASSGAGALSETYEGLVIDLKTQLLYFKSVKKMLEQKLGQEEAQEMLSRAVYLFNVGTNDYTSPFATDALRFYSKEEFVGMVVGNLTVVAQEIYRTGGRKFGFVNLGPLGCYPIIRALNPTNPGECVEDVTARVKLHNLALPRALKRLERRLQNFKYSNFDLYTSVSHRTNNPSKYGFKEGKSACCGSGLYRGLSSCGGRRGIEEYELCKNPSQFVFFDFLHLTEMANRQLAKLMWAGTPQVVKPYNVKALFEECGGSLNSM